MSRDPANVAMEAADEITRLRGLLEQATVALDKGEDVLLHARHVPAWSVYSETDSSAHHHSERRADTFDVKVNTWIGKADAALVTVRATLARIRGETPCR